MSRPAPRALFLDNGGVITDTTRLGAQWRPLVADFFAPRLGGSAQAWAEANRTVITSMLAQPSWQSRLRSAPDYESFERTYYLDWLADMCAIVGVACPPEDAALALAREVTKKITHTVQAPFPGAVETLRLLHGRGYVLYTASGDSSASLEGYLGTLGVRSCFTRLYGPDLIDTFKAGPEYYESILADAQVAPDDALVVDDNRQATAWAEEAGIRAVLVDPGGAPSTISRLSELPTLLERLE